MAAEGSKTKQPAAGTPDAWSAASPYSQASAGALARKINRRRLDPDQNLSPTVIDLCDGYHAVDLSTSNTMPANPALHNSSASRPSCARERGWRSHHPECTLPDAQSSAAATPHRASTPDIDLTGSEPSQRPFAYYQQLLTFADQHWKATNQLNQRCRAQKLMAESRQQGATRANLPQQILGLVGDELVKKFNLSKSSMARPRQGSASSSAGSSSLPQNTARDAGYIDLVNVTESYSGAIETAAQRVDHASSDAALATALAEKAELERQLKAALASKGCSHPSRPLRAPSPSHWAPMPEDMTVMYVQLPLPQGCSPAAGDQAMRSQSPPLDLDTLLAMMQQGLNQADAEAALRHCSGDGDAALLYALHCMDHGGAAACATRNMADLACFSLDDVARAAAEEEVQAAAVQEAQRVLDRLTDNNSPIQLADVRRIERVQNPHLWTKYCLRRHEVELAAGPDALNEQMLFHGCRKDTMAIIGREGFDIRVSGTGCSLGTGTYFAGNSSYSLGYVDRGPDLANLVTHGRFAGLPSSLASQISYAPASFGVQRQLFPSGSGLLPNHGSQGMARPDQKHSPRSRKNYMLRDEDGSKPDFLPETKAMLLCRVALGRLAAGSPGMRLPPKGSDSVTNSLGHHAVFPQALASAIFAVFDNSQAYPEYIVHFTCKHSGCR